MSSVLIDAPGEIIEPADITNPKASDLVMALTSGKIEFCRFVECRKTDTANVIVLDVEVELGQKRVHDIRATERIAIQFDEADACVPKALALRSDFPSVPHINISFQEFPRELCLYATPYDELKRQWTSTKFIERIRTWLALSAKGKLHQDDQPLEPLLWGTEGTVVFPSDVMTRAKGDDVLFVRSVRKEKHDNFLVAEYVSKKIYEKNELTFVTFKIKCPAKTHGTIRFRPSNLKELAEFCDDNDFSLLAEIRSAVSEQERMFDEWLELQTEFTQPKRENLKDTFLASAVMLLMSFPKKRNDASVAETIDHWAFCTVQTVRELGIDIGLWIETYSDLGKPLAPDLTKSGEHISLELYNPKFNLTRRLSSIYNGISSTDLNSKFVAVGAGALGSNVILGLARQGYGSWTVVDNDHLNPHNLARHALDRGAIGWNKAEWVGLMANQFCEDGSNNVGVNVNVLSPGDQSEKLICFYKEADAILDLSASVAVERHLAADVESGARRVSVFMNPSGSDLVVLAEDAERETRLDHLEMNYYREIGKNADLKDHFVPSNKRIRYGQSCRDVSFQISNELVTIHSAIACRAIRKALESNEPSISIWRTTGELEVNRVCIEPSKYQSTQISDWEVLTDVNLIIRMQELRESKLPNETGGVLLGSIDFDRKKIYLVDTIASPPDSEEWPTAYIRGAKGLKPEVDAIHKSTDGAIHYMGEWHSHPNRCSTAPSDDDVEVFKWLNATMGKDGHPPIMMIVGESGISCFVGEILRAENLVLKLKTNRKPRRKA